MNPGCCRSVAELNTSPRKWFRRYSQPDWELASLAMPLLWQPPRGRRGQMLWLPGWSLASSLGEV